MDMKVKAALISLTLILNGCATATKSVLMGAAVGGLAGSAMGQSQSQNSQGTMVGLAVGAGLGGLIGYFARKDKTAKVFVDTNIKEIDEIPFLTKPKIRSVIIPDTIEGNKFIKSHKVFILDDAGNWSKD